MAETSFSRIDHRTPLVRPEVNRTGPGWDPTVAPPGSAREDRTTHLPFVVPGGLPPAAPVPAPPPPTEAELRERLSAACEARRDADAALARAQTAHDRAVRHVERSEAALSRFATLDQAVTEHTIEALRCDAGRVSTELPEELKRLLADRDLARVDLAAAGRALEVLSAELASARDGAAAATKRVDAPVCALLARAGDAVAREHAEAVAVVDRLFADLVGLDRFISPRGGHLSQAVREALMAPPIDRRGMGRKAHPRETAR